MTRHLLCVFAILLAACNSWGITLSGSVVNGNGKTPAKGIIIQVEHHENRHSQSPDAFVVKKVTGDDGRFSIDLSETKQQYMLFVADEKGHVFTGYAHAGESTNYGTIVLQRGCSLSGLVRDTEGKPLADAEVILDIRLQKYTCSHYIEAARTRASAKGEFTFPDLSPAEYSYRAASPLFAAKSGTCQVSEDPAYVEIRMEKPTTIKGRILDDQGKPVVGIKVTAGPDMNAESDAQGNYVIRNVIAGNIGLSVSGKGYVAKEGRNMTVKCGKGTEVTKDITVVAAGVLKLRLELSEAGITLPAELSISVESQRGIQRNYFSQYYQAGVQDSMAVFSNIPPGKYQIRIRNDDLSQTSTNATIIAGQETQQTLRLAKVLSLTGKVVDESGNPVNNASVALQAVSEKGAGGSRSGFDMPAPDEWKHATSDAKGEFKVGGLKPGKRDITVTHQDFASTNRILDVIEGKLSLEPFVMMKGLKISGSVLEADGKPARNIAVEATVQVTASDARTMRRSFSGSKRAEVGENGTFAISGVDPGKYRLQFTDTESRQTEATLESVEAGTDDAMVSLSRKHAITGTVTDAAGKPLKGARFQATKQQGGQTMSFFSFRSGEEGENTTDAAGNFTLNLREGAKYVITFTSPSLLPQKSVVDLSAGAKPGAPLKIVMMPGYKVTGIVVGKQGKPAAGLDVRASSGGYEDMFSGMYEGLSEDNGDEGETSSAARPKPTDAQGRFSLDGVPAGVVKLNVFARTDGQQKLVASKEVMVAKDKPTDVRVELPEMGSVKGHVLDADGKPLEGCQVMLMCPANPMSQHNAETDDKGAFQFTDVAAGKYMAMWFDAKAQSRTPTAPVAVEVTEGKTTEVALGPRKTAAGGMGVSGIIKKDDKPIAGGKLTFMPVPDEKASAFEMMAAYQQPIESEVSSNGAFAVSGVSTGVYCYFYTTGPDSGEDTDTPQMPIQLGGTVTFAVGQTNIIINITGVTVTGVVSATDGKPVDKAYVILMPAGKRMSMAGRMQMRYGMSEADGTYKVDSVPPGSYDISIRHEANGMTTLRNVTVSATAHRFDVKLSAGVAVSGKVTDEAGSGKARVTILAVPDGVELDETMEGGYAMTDEDGRYDLQPPLSAGKYSIFVMHPGYALDAAVIALPGTTNHNASLVVGGDIAVTVKSKGSPAKDKNVVVKDAKGSTVLRIRGGAMLAMTPMANCAISPSDDQGKTTVRSLRPGQYTVTVEDSKASAVVEVKPLETAEVTLNL